MVGYVESRRDFQLLCFVMSSFLFASCYVIYALSDYLASNVSFSFAGR
jgi:hypothetical protein